MSRPGGDYLSTHPAAELSRDAGPPSGVRGDVPDASPGRQTFEELIRC